MSTLHFVEYDVLELHSNITMKAVNNTFEATSAFRTKECIETERTMT